jgi:hypothetical protein
MGKPVIATKVFYSSSTLSTSAYCPSHNLPPRYVNVVEINTLRLPCVTVTSISSKKNRMSAPVFKFSTTLSDGVSIGHEFDLRPRTLQYHK